MRKKTESLADELAPLPGSSADSDLGSRSRRIKEEPMDTDEKEAGRSHRKPIQAKKVYRPQPTEDEDDDDLAGIVIEDEAINELQSVLEKARKMKMMESKRENKLGIDFEKLAEQGLQNIEKQEQEEDSEELWQSTPSTSSSKFITLNSTAEFCRNLGEMPTYGLAGNRMEDDDIVEFERELEEEARLKRKGQIERDHVEQMDQTDMLDHREASTSKRGTWNEVDMDAADNDSHSRPEIETIQEHPILEEEPDVAKGVAGALVLAMKKGYLEKEETKKGALSARTAALQAQSYTIEEKF